MTATDLTMDTAGTDSSDDAIPHAIEVVEGVMTSADHTTVGKTLIAGGLVSAVAGYLVTALWGVDAFSEGDLLGSTSTAASRFFLSHSMGLSLGVAIPLLLGLAVLVVPSQLRANTLAFPRATAFGAWAWCFGAVMYWVSVLTDGGFGGANMKLAQLALVSVALMSLSLIVVAVSVVTSVYTLRDADTPFNKVSYFAYANAVFGGVVIVNLAALLALVFFWYIQNPSSGDLGVIAFGHFDWLFRPPAVAMYALPLLGIMADAAGASTDSRLERAGIIHTLMVISGATSVGAWAVNFAARETVVWSFDVFLAAVPILGIAVLCLASLAKASAKPHPALGVALAGVLVASFSTLIGELLAVNSAGQGQAFDLSVGGFFQQVDEVAGTDLAGGPGLALAQFYGMIAISVVAVAAGLTLWDSAYAGSRVAKTARAVGVFAAIGGLVMFVGQTVIGIASPDPDGVNTLLGVTAAGAALLALAALGLALSSVRPTSSSTEEVAA